MNSSSNYGKPGSSQRGGVSLNNFDFDLGIGSNKPRSLNDQKNKPAPYSYTPSNATSSSSTPQQRPSWQPNKPSWTHQPAPTQAAARPGSLSGPTSMAGDIFGKSWGSSGSSAAGSGVGIVEKNPNLFGDLVSSALGQGKSNGNAPLKSSTPASAANKSVYSMGNLADSLPKQPNSAKTTGAWGSSGSYGSFTKPGEAGPAPNVNLNGGNANKNVNLGGQSMKSMAGNGVGMSSNKDPFSNLVGLGSKQQGANLSSGKGVAKTSAADESFGDFQNAPSKPSSTTAFPSFPSSGFAANNSGFPTPNSSSDVNMGGFETSTMNFSQPAAQRAGVDQFDSLFSSSSASGGGGATASEGFGGQQDVDDWGLDSDFGGNDGGATTELEGLPPPPTGVSTSAAKSKGMDNYKQGQYADAIKWLSWAEVLIAKTGDTAAATEVLTCRASCYKEVGEYKKAVADCTKVLENDEANVAVLCQRALLYESMEKYRLGAEDLRAVLKIDPGNRIARSTIHRLNKMAD